MPISRYLEKIYGFGNDAVSLVSKSRLIQFISKSRVHLKLYQCVMVRVKQCRFGVKHFRIQILSLLKIYQLQRANVDEFMHLSQPDFSKVQHKVVGMKEMNV